MEMIQPTNRQTFQSEDIRQQPLSNQINSMNMNQSSHIQLSIVKIWNNPMHLSQVEEMSESNVCLT